MEGRALLKEKEKIWRDQEAARGKHRRDYDNDALSCLHVVLFHDPCRFFQALFLNRPLGMSLDRIEFTLVRRL